MINKEQYEALLPYETHLRRGYKGKYTFGLTKPIFDRLYDIYKELGFERNQTYSCNSCLLDLTSTLGRVFFEYQEKLAETPLESSQTEPVEQLSTTETKVAEKPKKVARKATKTVKKK